MKKNWTIVGCAAVFQMLGFAQTTAPRVLTLDMAQTLAQDALASCHAQGYSVTVLVVDGLDAPKILLRADGAPAATTQIGQMKATTTLLFDRPSGSEAPATPGGQPPAPVIPGTINSAGGVPIKVSGVTIGAIAVSGAPGGDKDAACANAALAKFSSRWK